MSVTGEILTQLAQLIDNAQSIVVLLPTGAVADEVAAALAWAATLRDQGKDVQLVAASQPQIGETRLDGLEEIATDLGKQNLVISFDYSPEQVDKVSYHIGEATNRFYLTIRPKKGVPPLAQESLEVAYAGAEADLLVYIGVADLEQLQPLSGEYPEFFQETPSVVLAAAPSFGSVQIETTSAAGLSEETAQLFAQLGWDVGESAATALLRGIEETTEHLTSLATTPETFEMVALLLRSGARRSSRRKAGRQSVVPVGPAASSGPQKRRGAPAPATEGENLTMSMTPASTTMPAQHVAPQSFADVLKRGSSVSDSPLPLAQDYTSVDDAAPELTDDGAAGQPSAHSSSQPSPQADQSSRYLGRRRYQPAHG